MKVTKALVRAFRLDQESYGTKVALKNILWLAADTQLRELGAKAVKVDYRKEAKGGRKR
jgi:hypothetical protein